MAPNFGLVSKSNGKKVPLESIKIEASVSGFTAHVTSTLQYTNKEDNPIEVIYIFPLDEQAAVCGFQATIDGRTIVAEVHEKQEAKDIYDDAISSGHGAYLLEESDESSDIFRISVGNLPPKKSATVELKFVTELAVEKEGRIVFVLPNVLRPRYSPAGIGPSLSTQVPSVPSVESPYSFDFEMKVKTSSAITDINSPSGSLNVKIDANDKNKASVSLAGEHKGDRDIEVHIVTAEPFKPYAVVEDGVVKPGSQSESDFMAKPVVMLNFFPEFPSGPSTAGEFIFIVDRSGSMSASDRIRSASETLLLFLKSLPSGCHFNVVGFGSHHELLFKKSETYCDKSVEEACKHAENMAADLGGTEILEPLKWVFSQPLIKGAPRQVFLLTDGGVQNTQQVIDLVRNYSSTARCFTFGIGEGASTALIKGVARAGRGTAVFVTSEARLQAKVIRVLKHALQPSLRDVKTTWCLPVGWTVVQTPSETPALFVGEKLVLYGVLERGRTGEEKEKSDSKGDKSEVCQGSVELQASINDVSEQENKKEVKHFIHFELKTTSEESGCPAKIPFFNKSEEVSLHQIAAKSYIQEKQALLSSTFDVTSTAKIKEAAIKFSKAASVISKFTAFVAVDEETHEPVTSAMQQRVVPRVSEIQSLMQQNIDSVMERDEKLAGLDCQAESLSASSGKFMKSAKKSGGWFSFPSFSLPSFSFPSLFGSPGSSASEDEHENIGCAIKRIPQAQQWDSVEVDREKTLSSPSDQRKQLHDPLMWLVTLQKAAGYWEFTEELAKLCGSSKAELLGAYPSNKAARATEEDDRAWATALALVLLMERFVTMKGEWEMVAEKGKAWLTGNLPPNSGGFDDILASASKALKN